MPALALALAGVGIALGRTSQQAMDRCPLEQAWFDGDQHFWQELQFGHDGNGTWTTGGMASDAPQKRLEFRWQADGSRLTAETGGELRTVRYEIKPLDEDGCWIRFEDVFLPDEGQSRHYSNHR
jgi:hypothetical protein